MELSARKLTPGRTSSFEVLRTLGLLAVIIIHCETFLSAEFSNFPAAAWAGEMLRSLSRFAVPYFFILSGYLFVQSSSQKGIPETELFKKYLKRLLPLFLAWSLIYAFVPHRYMETFLDKGLVEGVLKRVYWHAAETLESLLAHPLSFLFHGTKIHLWFLSSLLISLGFWTGFRKFSPGKEKVCLFAGALGYAYASAVVVYSEVLGISVPMKYAEDFYSGAQALVGPLFVSLGAMMKISGWRASVRTQGVLMASGIFLIAAERFGQEHFHVSSAQTHGILYGTIPLAAGIFQAALTHPEWGRHSLFEKFGEDMLGVYLIHYAVLEGLTFRLPLLPPVVWEMFRPLLILLIAVLWVQGLKRIKPLAFLVR